MNVDKLIENLKKATYRDQDMKYDWNVLRNSAATVVAEKIILEWAAEQTTEVALNKRCAELEAKCYAYEKIIANSNFAPVIGKETPKEKTIINLNDRIKVKLTERGIDLYYHRHDEMIEAGMLKEDQRPPLPVDKEGKTEFQLWDFISLYGEHIGMCVEPVIQPLIIEKVGE